MPGFTVRVAYVGEGEHQPAERTFEDVVAVATDDDGNLDIIRTNGRSARLAATSWGAFKVVRVPSAADRI